MYGMCILTLREEVSERCVCGYREGAAGNQLRVCIQSLLLGGAVGDERPQTAKTPYADIRDIDMVTMVITVVMVTASGLHRRHPGYSHKALHPGEGHYSSDRAGSSGWHPL